MSAHSTPRGAALVELTLVLPIILAALFSGLYLAELSRVRLKLAEATRLAADTLGQYRAIDEARLRARTKVTRRYEDLDGARDLPAGPALAARATGLSLSLAPMRTADAISAAPRWPGGDANPHAAAIAAQVRGDFDRVAARMGFEPDWLTRVEAKVDVAEGLLPVGWLFASLSSAPASHGARSRFSLRESMVIGSSDWHLEDGSDVVMGGSSGTGAPMAGLRADGRPHALHQRVARMTHLGMDAARGEARVMAELLSWAGIPSAAPWGAFVVSHRYGVEGTRPDRRCVPGDPGHPAREGLNNLEVGPGIDDDRRRCFDTMPLRQTQAFGRSPLVQQLARRGPYFMGCQLPMADDPSESGRPQYAESEQHQLHVPCEQPWHSR